MSNQPTSCARGFTLVELLVVMGILSGFLLMLVQLVDGGLSMFSEGELGQVMTDRASRAQRVLQDELRQLRSSASGRERQAADDRLVVQMLPIGLPARPERGATRIPMLRGAVRLHPDREIELLGPLLLARVAEERPALPLDAARAEAERLAQQEPLRGVGNVLLVPWPQSGDDDALLELRAAWFLPGQRVPVGQGRFVDPFSVPTRTCSCSTTATASSAIRTAASSRSAASGSATRSVRATACVASGAASGTRAPSSTPPAPACTWAAW
jgi:prepilin-type N-terminal cleavage/methylation domain-containing protein